VNEFISSMCHLSIGSRLDLVPLWVSLFSHSALIVPFLSLPKSLGSECVIIINK
jgi:hypothetical protein